MQSLLKPLFLIGLIGALVLSNSHDALAARSGGRIGGGSFRAPSRTSSTPARGYSGGGMGYGGGMGFPFLLPFFGFGGFGSLFSILIVLAIANFVINAIRNVGAGSGENIMESDNPPVGVVKIQVGLLANARALKKDLDELGLAADTGTPSGRAMVLQEATLALLRHPEYWVYGSTESQAAPLSLAEAKFNQLALAERSKFSSETLSNVNNQLRQAQTPELLKGHGDLATIATASGGDYIIVTVIAAALGKLELPVINDSSHLRQALQQIGAIGSDRLLAIEVLWTPQAEGDSLTTDDILAEYPTLKLV
ncbi:MAG: DUF1517 domain-containing protein [Snowella sp.]|nr:DUF1517 domain-containing protein [Snowella sp.]